MTLRTMLGIGWSILFGLAGGWLVLMPWALNVQGDGDWTDQTLGAFWTGLALLAVCAIGLAVTVGLAMRTLAPEHQSRQRQAVEAAEGQAELDRALLQIASKLAADLNAPASGQANGRTAASPADNEPLPEGAAVLTQRGTQR